MADLSDLSCMLMNEISTMVCVTTRNLTCEIIFLQVAQLSGCWGAQGAQKFLYHSIVL
jgi:hypothetical protein